MWYIIIGLVVVGVIWSILSSIYENLSSAVGSKTVIITLVLCVVAFFAFSWVGVLIVAVCGLGIAFFLKKTGQAIVTHDRSKKETAQIYQASKKEQAAQQNEYALRQELDKNCRWLGYMNSMMWASKLPNYKDKLYQTSFDTITTNFARQMEQQNILQSNAWFQPFFQYILNHPAGTTPTKLLNEVNCPQLQITHITPTVKLIEAELKKGTKRISKDVPPLYEEHSLNGMNENLYVPTRYALYTYGSRSGSNEIHKQEISIDDL